MLTRRGFIKLMSAVGLSAAIQGPLTTAKGLMRGLVPDFIPLNKDPGNITFLARNIRRINGPVVVYDALCMMPPDCMSVFELWRRGTNASNPFLSSFVQPSGFLRWSAVLGNEMYIPSEQHLDIVADRRADIQVIFDRVPDGGFSKYCEIKRQQAEARAASDDEWGYYDNDGECSSS